MRPTFAVLRQLAIACVIGPMVGLGLACASGNTPSDSVLSAGEAGDKGPQSQVTACLLHDCSNDAECGACSDGRTTCLVDEHRCVACDSGSGTGCAEGQYCSSYGQCVPDGKTCPTDPHGTPTITCSTSADCVACDPMHQVCDTATSQCVACTVDDTSECQATDLCVGGTCSAKCPASCSIDTDCSQCGAPGHEAHACNAHKCSQCSATYACPAGETCSAQGTCMKQCGSDGKGACQSDADCAACGGGATACHEAINDPVGKCGPAAAGCSDLGQGVAVLPDPWSKVTNLCSNDADCAGVGVDLDIGKMLRDVTGIDQIKDADITYGMNVCASVSVADNLSCGVCVPCKQDNDCNDIDIDQVAAQAFGPLGSIAAAILLDQVFGANDHVVHMYCQTVAGDYGVCAPCPGLLYACGVDGGGGGGGGGTCDHDACSTGGPLDGSCDACASTLCSVDSYCCTTAWDSQCVSEVDPYCATSCGGGGGGGGASCSHDECSTGSALDGSCSSCASSVCGADSYCCTTSWDSTCVNEADQYCGGLCGGGGGGGTPECYSPADCPWPWGCLPDGTCGACSSDSDCYPDSCDWNSGQCY